MLTDIHHSFSNTCLSNWKFKDASDLDSTTHKHVFRQGSASVYKV